MLPVSEARERILTRMRPGVSESVAVADSAGRVLARDVIAGRALPPFDNSAMDGVAIRAAEAPGPLEVAGTQAAGSPVDAMLATGRAMRIMTGAPVPSGADAVVPREELDDRGESVLITAAVTAGQHIRRAGEDLAVGATAVSAGEHVGAGEMAALAALGVTDVEVGRRPRVAIVSTGSELVPLGQEPRPGQIISSNNVALAEQIRRAGGVAEDLGIAKDTVQAVRERIEAALSCDFIITSGGVSVGEFDYVRKALEQLNIPLDFWRVAMKPGKPVAFGVHPDGPLFFGLPGNPVSTFVSFELFVRPSILAFQGAATLDRPCLSAELTESIEKRPGRSHFLRATVEFEGQRPRVSPRPRQGSGMLSSLVGFNSLIELPMDSHGAKAGELVTVHYLVEP